MGSDLRYLPLKECATWYSGGTPRKSQPSYWDGMIPWISAKSLVGTFISESEDRVTELGVKNGTRLVPKNTILFVVRGMSLKTEFRIGVTTKPVTFNQDLKALTANEGVDPTYLYYALKAKTPEILSMVEEAGHGTGVLATSVIERLSIPVPPLPKQKLIANAFLNKDKKITLNNQINQTLEQMAQTLFKSWFVDFDPVKAKMNGEQPKGMDAPFLSKEVASLFPDKLVESELGLIPEGWEETPLYDIAEYINGAAYKKFEPNGEGLGLPIVKIAELKAGVTSKTGFSTVDMPQKYKLDDTDILFSWSGNPDTSIDTFVWALGEAWLNQHIFKVVPKSDLSRDYVLCLLKYMRPVFAEIARDKQTTGLGHVTVKDLKRLTVAVPSEELLIKFNEKVSAIIAHNFSLVKENQTLVKLRDTLLPKLLSGEIDLENVQVEQAKALPE